MAHSPVAQETRKCFPCNQAFFLSLQRNSMHISMLLISMLLISKLHNNMRLRSSGQLSSK